MKTNIYNDSHTHISLDTSLKKDIECFNWVMEKSGVKRINFLALNAHVKFQETQLDNSKCLFLKHMFKPFGYAGYCLDYTKENSKEGFKKQIELAIKAGFDCWKIIEGKPNSQCVWKNPIDNEIYDSAFELAEKEQFPIIIHVADPIDLWKTDYKEGFLEKHEYQQQLFNVLEKHPNLVLTIAHMGFMSDEPLRVEKMLNTYPNLYLDNVPAPEEYFVISKYHKEWKEIFEKYSTRFLFGTDRGNHDTTGYTKEQYFKEFPETASYQRRLFELDGPCDGRHPFPGIEELWGTEWHGLGLSDETFNNIFYNNFLRIYGEPKKIDFKLLLEIADHEFKLPSKSKSLKEDYEFIKEECIKNIK